MTTTLPVATYPVATQLVSTAPTLTNQGVDALYRYSVGEHVDDVARFLGVTRDLAGVWLADACGMDRDRAYQLALTTRSRT